MAKFLLWSDLHKEMWDFTPPRPEDLGFKPDALLIAGDTDTQLRHLTFAKEMSDMYDCPVVMVDGNHEFYHSYYHEFLEAEQEILKKMRADGDRVHVLHGDEVEIAGVRIIGASFWTDFNLNPASIFGARDLASQVMNDYRVIGLSRENPKLLTPADTIGFHLEEKARVWKHLQTPYPGPTLVMTHHLPIKQAIHKKYLHHKLNSAFASDLAHEIMEFDFDTWVYGHSHENNEVELEALDGTLRRFLSNPRGYEGETRLFDPCRCIEV